MSTSLSQASSNIVLASLPPEEIDRLGELLKRCPPSTLTAAVAFRRTHHADHLLPFILGVLERFVERELRPKLNHPDDSLRLIEDLALDSLTLMEVILLIEDALEISVDNDELTRLRTIGDIRNFVAAKTSSRP